MSTIEDVPPVSSSFDDFKGPEYNAHHYLNRVGEEDAQIISGLGGWVAEQLRTSATPPHSLPGPHLEVGPAETLHWPGLLEPTMAPGAELVRVEFSRSNVAGLARALREPLDPGWLPTEAAMVVAGGDQGVYWEGVLQRLRARSVVRQGSIYDLPAGVYGSGAMFFVACSIDRRLEWFNAAVDAFTRSLRPGAPYVVAFMEESEGYSAGEGTRFESCSVTMDQIRAALARHSRVELCKRTTAAGKVRTGYKAMVYAAGRAR